MEAFDPKFYINKIKINNIAIDLDEKLKTILRNYILDLASTRTKVRWVKTEGMHLTLKFLGEINQTQADQVIKELQNITEHYTPFPLA